MKQEATPGSNTCDAQHGNSLLNLLICFDLCLKLLIDLLYFSQRLDCSFLSLAVQSIMEVNYRWLRGSILDN